MIASRTIQQNGDRTYDISVILLSHNEENDQKVGFRDLKWRNGAHNWNLCEKLIKIGPVQKFWLWSKSQQSTLLVNGPVCWCHWMTCDADMAADMLGLTWCSEELSTCSTWHDWRIVTEACQAHEACKSACSVFSTSRNLGGAWGCVGAPLGQFLVRFWLEKSDLSRCNCGSTIWLMNRLDPRGSGWVWRRWLASDSGYQWRWGQRKNVGKYH